MESEKTSIWQNPKLFFPILGLIVIIGITSLILIRANSSAEEKPADVGPYSVISPNDGDLMIGSTAITQMQGQCPEAGSCRFKTPTDLKTVVVNPAKPPTFAAKQSKSFNFSVTSGPTPTPTLSVAAGKLNVTSPKTGKWLVTASGAAGGMWSFYMDIPTTKK